MKQRICICVLIFFMLFTNTFCIAYADDGFDSKLTVFLAGEIIEKIQVSLVFENSDPVIFAVPCSMTNYNIKYDEQNFLFDYISYGDYSLCVVVPVGNVDNFYVDISNEHNEIYEGISLTGTIINGEYEMHLSIPVIEPKFPWKHCICQFSVYSIFQVYPYSSITYAEDGRKVLTEELAGDELLLPIPIGKHDNIVYTYSMDRTFQEESSPAMAIITSIILPFLICTLQLLYPDNKKDKAFSFRNILLYIIVFCLMFYAIYLNFTTDLPKWVFVVTMLVFVFCIGCIVYKIAPIINKDKVKEKISKFNFIKKRKLKKLPPSEENAIKSKTNE